MTRSRSKDSSTLRVRDWLPFALLSVFAMGCVSDWQRWQPRRRLLRFQVDRDSPLFEPALRAARAWSAATGRPITVSPDGEYPIFLSDSPSCWNGKGTPPRGCSAVSTEPGDGYIAIFPRIAPEDRYGVLLHEMGHHLRGKKEPIHLGPGHETSVMYVPRLSEELTAADVAFVCENFDCERPDTS